MEKDLSKFTIIIMYICIIINIWLVLFGINDIDKKINSNKYDVNSDGVVDAQDYVLIKNYIMEKEIGGAK